MSTQRPWDWTDFLGQHRTIAIHTPILAWTGDYHAAALFEELVWRWNESDRQAFTVTDAELMAKLYMTRGALRGARARLAELGAVGTVKRGIPPVLHYTVDPYAMAPSVEPTLVQFQPNDDLLLAQRVAEIELTSIDTECIQSKEQSNTSAPSGADGPPPSADTDTPSLTPVAAGDRKTTPWEELGRDIAESLTGDGEKAFVKRGKRAGQLQAWVGDIVGMVGKAAADKPIAAYDVWLAFQESIPSEEWARYISRHNVGDRFGKWSQNGGQPAIRAAVAADEAWETRSVAS